MLRRTETYWVLMVLFVLTGAYSFWLSFQWWSIGSEPGADLDVVWRNTAASVIAGSICVVGVIALTIAHIRKMRPDI